MEHHRNFGSGPFYVIDGVEIPFCRYRGQQVQWDLTSAFGQWGDIQIEFNQQNDPAPSIFHDVFPAGSGKYGMHHLAFIVDDIRSVAKRFDEQGFATILHARMANGIEGLLIDTIRSNGHLLELFEPIQPVLEFFEFIRSESLAFEGKDPVRSM